LFLSLAEYTFLSFVMHKYILQYAVLHMMFDANWFV